MGKSERPEEVSFKKPVSRFRSVISTTESIKKKPRDPRFDTLSGHLDQNKIKQRYSFLNEYRTKEKEILVQSLLLHEETPTTKKQDIKLLLDRITSQEASEKRTEQLHKAKSERRKLEQELVAQGKKPFFLKRSDQKKEVLIDKFYELKQKNPTLDINRLTEKRHLFVSFSQFLI